MVEAWQEGADEAPAWLFTAEEFGETERNEIAAWLDGTGRAPDWFVGYWVAGPGQRVNFQVTFAIDDWTNNNCDALTDQPGTVSVLYPRIEGSAGDTLIMAVMPRGSTVDDLASPASVLAGWCEGVQSDPWGSRNFEERWQSEPFGAERWTEDSLCDYRHEAGPARLDAGTYTMVAAVIEGDWSQEAAPSVTSCSVTDIHIDGDTVIEMAEPSMCTVDLGESPDPWRNLAPIDPSTPGAGTLQIVFPDLVLPELGGVGGEVLLFVLPAGTTLNDMGREQVWPVGATRTWLMGDDRAGNERDVMVPVAELPATGSPRSLQPDWLADRPPADRLPLAMLAPGAYDVHVQVQIPDPPEQEHSDRADNDRCVSFEVTINGDTVVTLPELEECPRTPW